MDLAVKKFPKLDTSEAIEKLLLDLDIPTSKIDYIDQHYLNW